MNRKSLDEAITDSQQISIELLMTDAKTALTFLDLARTTDIAEIRSRRIAEAVRSYQSILYFLQRLNPTADQNQILSGDLETLKTRLNEAGATVD